MSLCKVRCQLNAMVEAEGQKRPLLVGVIKEGIWNISVLNKIQFY